MQQKKTIQVTALVIALGVTAMASQPAQATYGHDEKPKYEKPSHEEPKCKDKYGKECDCDDKEVIEIIKEVPVEVVKEVEVIKEVPVVVEKVVEKTKTKVKHKKGKTKTKIVYVTQPKTLPATGVPIAGVAALALATSGLYVGAKKLSNRK